MVQISGQLLVQDGHSPGFPILRYPTDPGPYHVSVRDFKEPVIEVLAQLNDTPQRPLHLRNPAPGP
jgi:hypothetical protein